jgi:hypothetical protein
MRIQLAALLLATLLPQGEPDPSALVATGVRELVRMQEEGGAWPYEGVYRVGGEIPVGYRVGGTAIAAGTLLLAAPEDREARAAFERGLACVLVGLGHKLLEPSIGEGYDVRVWAHASALEFLCHVRARKAGGEHTKELEAWIPKLVGALETEEIPGGGWNYAGHSAPASFVTAPVAQALLYARGEGARVPEGLLARARKILERARATTGAFLYSGLFKEGESAYTSDQLPGSSARSPACEATLLLLAGGSIQAVRGAIDAFHEHWQALEDRRKGTGTHLGPYRIAPYYFYFGHFHAAQAIGLLPEKDRPKERERLLKVIVKTRDADGTWNDRVFPRSRSYGTSMIVRALLPAVPTPPPAK